MVLLAVASMPLFAAQAVASPQHVMIENYAYGSASVTVNVGDSITWTNHDQASHDVVTTSAPSAFRSSLMATGQSWSYTFTTPGTYSYYCSLHPDMKAQVVVLAPITPAPVPVTPPPAAVKPTVRTLVPTTHATSAVATTSGGGTIGLTQPAPNVDVAGAAQPVQRQMVPGEPVLTRSLDPRLIVAGIVTAISTLCLLMISARRGN
jgi:plastocyanin